MEARPAPLLFSTMEAHPEERNLVFYCASVLAALGNMGPGGTKMCAEAWRENCGAGLQICLQKWPWGGGEDDQGAAVLIDVCSVIASGSPLLPTHETSTTEGVPGGVDSSASGTASASGAGTGTPPPVVLTLPPC